MEFELELDRDLDRGHLLVSTTSTPYACVSMQLADAIYAKTW